MLDTVALRLQPLRDAKFLAEGFNWFIQSESGWVSREFEEYPAWLTKIDRMKIDSINDRCYVQMFGNFLAPFSLRRIVFSSKRDVMHGAGAGTSKFSLRIDEQIYMISMRLTLG